jgi:hypothetical protein
MNKAAARVERKVGYHDAVLLDDRSKTKAVTRDSVALVLQVTLVRVDSDAHRSCARLLYLRAEEADQ